MKKCINCGAEPEDNAKFCFQCGTPVSAGVAAPTPAPATQPANTNGDVAVSQRDGDTIAITIIDRDKDDNEYYTRLFAKEHSCRSMLRPLGY